MNKKSNNAVYEDLLLIMYYRFCKLTYRSIWFTLKYSKEFII